MTLDLPHIKAVIFDLNGTIIDDSEYHQDAFQEFFRRHNLQITREEYHTRYGSRKNEEFFPIAFGREMKPEEAHELSLEKEDIYHELYGPYIKEVAGFTALAQTLKQKGIKIGLATSSIETNLDFTFEHLPIKSLFDVIVCGSEVEKSKPDPQIYLLTAEKLGVEPQHCLVFEDSPVGVQAALAARMRVIGVLTNRTAEELPVVTGTIKTFAEIVAQ